MPGWTLNPRRPAVLPDTADYVRRVFNIGARVLRMPNTHNPDPVAWKNHLRGQIKRPQSTIMVFHSLAGINGIGYIAEEHCDEPGYYPERKYRGNPNFMLGGAIFLAANTDDLGFEEITPHFPDKKELYHQLAHVAISVPQIRLIYGRHDPFVSTEHGKLLGKIFDQDVIVDSREAHFSGPHHDETSGVDIPACRANFMLCTMLTQMIMNVIPPDAYPSTTNIRLDYDNPEPGVLIF